MQNQTVLEIGNHARGAMFMNASHKITPALITTIDNLCKKIDGFYYGRLDIKFEDWNSLEQGEKFGIVELNGAGSEPTHIYDPSNNILQAWKEICRHWKFLYDISKYNNRRGTAYLNWKEALIMFRNNALINKKLAIFAGPSGQRNVSTKATLAMGFMIVGSYFGSALFHFAVRVFSSPSTSTL